MISIFSVTIPIFLIIGTGFAASRFFGLKRDDVRGLVLFVWYFALPALIFRAVAQHSFAELAHGDYLAAYAVGSLLSYGFAFGLAFFWRRKSLSESAVMALGASSSNSGYIGYPVAALVVGPAAAIALGLNMIVENMLMIPLALAVAEQGAGNSRGFIAAISDSLRSAATNPLIIALVLGAIVSFFGVALPVPITRAVDIMADGSGAVALFIVGNTFMGMRVRGRMRDVAQITLAKLIGHPFFVFVASLAFQGMDKDLRHAAVIFAAAPMMSIYPIIGLRFGLQENCAAALVTAVAASFFTISAVLMLW